MMRLHESGRRGRNDPCPCGSGLKHKRCCLKKVRRGKLGYLESSFVPLSSRTQVYYLDTNVWSELAKQDAARQGFISLLQTHERLSAVSQYILFELSRSPVVISKLDPFFFQMRHQIIIPQLYDQVIEAELESFPLKWKMRWLPLHRLLDKSNPSILQRLANDPNFLGSREQHRQFGRARFMKLEELKENFPPQHGDEYTIDDARSFAWGTTVDYLSRQFPGFRKSKDSYLRKRDLNSLNSLKSIRIRSLYSFFKYYLHGQSPEESDFFDFAIMSYVPYCDVFITEANACNVLNRIKKSGFMLEDVQILHITDFLSEVTLEPLSEQYPDQPYL